MIFSRDNGVRDYAPLRLGSARRAKNLHISNGMEIVMARRTQMWTAVSLLFACAAAPAAFAQDRSVVCESVDNARNSCPIRTDGHVRLVEQISQTPCVKHQNWDVEDRGIWVSDGCRGRFELVSREDGGRRGDEDRREGDADQGAPPPPPSADGASARLQAKCAHRVVDYRRMSPDDAVPQGSRVISGGLFEVTIGTPQGPMICTVDNDGNVRGINEAR
jgi:hypothetical protein